MSNEDQMWKDFKDWLRIHPCNLASAWRGWQAATASKQREIAELQRKYDESVKAQCELHEQIYSHQQRIAELERKLAEQQAYCKSACDVIQEFINDSRECGVEGGDIVVTTCESRESAVKFCAQPDYPELNKLLSEAREEGRKEAESSGWLIENGKKQGDGLAYRYINNVIGGLPDWTDNHLLALRFSRREDAEQFAYHDEDAELIAQHVWVDAPSPASLNAKEAGDEPS